MSSSNPTDHRAGWCFSDVEIDGQSTSCRVVDGRISAVGPSVTARPGDFLVDGRGGALLPGFADHHAHLWATAAAHQSIDLDGRADLATLSAPPGAGWLRIIGAGRLLEQHELDEVWPNRPVRVQHRSGAMWMLNSVAIDHLGAALDDQERATGQLWRSDQRLRRLLEAVGASVQPDLAALGRELAQRGITHVTDATPDLDAASVAALRAALPQHVLSMSTELPEPGPVKLIVADHAPPDFDEFSASIRGWHERGRPVAVHAVSRMSLAVTVAALADVGSIAGDRIEHAAVCDDALADRLAELGVTVVTQPGLWARRGVEFRAESPPDQRAHLWRNAGLLARGVSVVLSSDCPYGPGDPWAIIAAAETRELADGSVGGADERVSATVALQSLLRDPVDLSAPVRVVQPGAPADLVLLNGSLALTLASGLMRASGNIRMTLIRGVPVFAGKGTEASVVTL